MIRTCIAHIAIAVARGLARRWRNVPCNVCFACSKQVLVAGKRMRRGLSMPMTECTEELLYAFDREVAMLVNEDLERKEKDESRRYQSGSEPRTHPSGKKTGLMASIEPFETNMCRDKTK